MKRFLLPVLLVLFFCSSSKIAAQQYIDTFRDSVLSKPVGNISNLAREGAYIYVGAQAFFNNDHTAPTLVKLDTAGHNIWTYALSKETGGAQIHWGYNDLTDFVIRGIYIDSNIVFITISGGFLENKLQAIEKSTGRLMWSTNFVALKWPIILRSASPQLLAFGYQDESQTIYQLIDKQTGNIKLSQILRNLGRLEIERDGSTYYADKDTIYKYSSPIMDKLQWSTPIVASSDPFYKPNVSNIIPDKDGFIYCYGTTDGAGTFCARLEKESGKIGWLTSCQDVDDAHMSDGPADFKMTDNHIYIAAHQVYTGSVNTAYHAYKLNRLDGKQLWAKIYRSGGDTVPYYGGYLGINSFDLDNRENLYASGYASAGDWFVGRWSILKMDADGRYVYDKFLTDELQTGLDDVGMLTFHMNNNIYHLGNRNIKGRIHGYLLASDTSSSFMPYKSIQLPSTFQESSCVKGIQPFSTSKYVVYKQLGRGIQLELRDTKDHRVIWSMKLSDAPYLEADKIVVTNNVIAFTALWHDTAALSIDYRLRVDSIRYLRVDSMGEVLSKRSFYCGDMEKMKPLQLYTNGQSIVVMALTKYNAKGNGVFLLNLDRPEGTPGKMIGGGDQGEIRLPDEAKELIIGLPNNRIITPFVHAATGELQLEPNELQYDYVNQQDLAWGPHGIVIKPDYTFHNAAHCDDSSILLICSDTLTGRDVIQRFNLELKKVEWTNFTMPGSTISSAITVDRYVYYLMKLRNILLLKKVDKYTGAILWDKSMTAGGNRTYTPLDLRFNQQLRQIIICGFISDSTNTVANFPFYSEVDTSGHLISEWYALADLPQNSRLANIAILQNGQTLLGGSLYTLKSGKSGILLAANDGKNMAISELKVCSGDTRQLTSFFTGSMYQWQQDTGAGFRNIEDSGFIRGAGSAVLNLDNIPSEANNFRYRCLTDGRPGKVLTLRVTKSSHPSITVTGAKIVRAGASSTLRTTVQSQGDAPLYMWEDSTKNHTWLPISVATDDTLSYLPTTLNSWLRCTLTSNLGCAIPPAAISNPFHLMVDVLTGLPVTRPADTKTRLFPNPANTVFAIDGLDPADEWKILSIVNLHGETVLLKQVPQQPVINTAVDTLVPGIYIAILRNSRGRTQQYLFVKI